MPRVYDDVTIVLRARTRAIDGIRDAPTASLHRARIDVTHLVRAASRAGSRAIRASARERDGNELSAAFDSRACGVAVDVGAVVGVSVRRAMSIRTADDVLRPAPSTSSDSDSDDGDAYDDIMKSIALERIDADASASASAFAERITFVDACFACISTALSPSSRARDRREARMRLGKVYGAIVRGSALDTRADVITLAEITRFLSRSPALRPPTEAARVALENGIAAHMRALHRDGVLCTAGSIAEDEAHEVLHGDGLFARFIGRRCDAAIARATRALKKRYRALDDEASMRGDDDVLTRMRNVAIDGWLGAASDDEYDDNDDGGGTFDELTDAVADEDDLADFYDGEEEDDAAIAGTSRNVIDAEDAYEDDGVSHYVPVAGAEICDVEKDQEFILKEIISLRLESDQSIAKRVQANLEATRGAQDSTDGRRARLFADLFRKYSRTDTSQNVHTGAVVREMSSHNPKYNFFRGTEPKTRIEPTVKDIEFRSVDAHVKEKKAREDKHRKH